MMAGEKRKSKGMAAPTAFERVAREHILARVEEAALLLRSGLKRNLQRVRELLADAADHADAYDIVPRVEEPESDSTVESGSALLIATKGAPVQEFLLIPFGDNDVERPLSGASFEFTRAHGEQALKWFSQLGRKLAIDYEHQTFERHNPRPDGLRPAAGWIGALELRADGLWATNVSWTERATALLTNGEYRYFSPVIYWADEDYRELDSLGPVALTNDPALRGVQALAAARRAGANAELEAAEAEIALLKRQIAVQSADAFVERGMRAGKILDSTSMDWREDYLRDAEGTESRLARSPVILPPGRMVAAQGGVRTGAQEKRDGASSELYQSWGVERADLEAYERAVAAGRVRVGVMG